MKSFSAVPLYTGCDDDGLSFIVAPQIRTKKKMKIVMRTCL